MPQFLIPTNAISGDRFELEGDEAYHMVRVMRYVVPGSRREFLLAQLRDEMRPCMRSLGTGPARSTPAGGLPALPMIFLSDASPCP